MKKMFIILVLVLFIFTAFVTYANAEVQATDTVATPLATSTPVPTPAVTPTPTPTVTPAVTPTVTPAASPITTPSSSVSPSATPIATATPAPNGIDQPKVNITPDNPIYPIKRLIESVQVTLTFSPQGKAELLVSFAKERLAEAEIMTKKNKDKVVEKVMEAFTNTVKKANENIDAAAQNGADVKAVLEDIKVVEDSADKMTIKVTGVVPQTAADSLKTSVSDTVKTTLAQQSVGVAKSNLKAAKEELNVTKKEYKMVQEAGSPEAVKATEDKLTQSQQNKDKAEEILKNVEAYKDQIKDELKTSDSKDSCKENNKENKHKKKNKNKHKKMKDCFENNGNSGKNFNMVDENDSRDYNCEKSHDNDDNEGDDD